MIHIDVSLPAWLPIAAVALYGIQVVMDIVGFTRELRRNRKRYKILAKKQ